MHFTGNYGKVNFRISLIIEEKKKYLNFKQYPSPLMRFRINSIEPMIGY